MPLSIFTLQRSNGRDRSRSRERRRRSRSRDRYRSRSREDRRREKSRSRSPINGYDPNRQRRRPTWFDIQPVGGMPPPISSLPGAIQVTPSVPMGPATTSTFAGGPNQQATRHARRIYAGGLPTINEDDIASFFSNALAAVGGTTAGPGPCVVNVYINAEKRFAFIELRTVEEASNAMALDGIMFEGATVRIRRPADYNPTAAAALGPSAPNPNLNLAAIGLDKIKEAPQQTAPANVPVAIPPQQDQKDRIFVGGLPRYLSETECRELLGAFGTIKYFNFVRDRNTGDSKGYGFVQYDDPNVVEIAIAGLHGMRLGDRTLTVKRAESKTDAGVVAPPMINPDGGAMFTAVAPKVVKLVDAVTVEELQSDEDYNDIMEDMREELSKYGVLQALHIPRPPVGGEHVAGVGKVLAEFRDPSAAMAARNAIHGRKFGGRSVQASLVTEEDYKSGRWD